MAYVALGRSEELKDIYIKGKVDPEGIHASPEALAEMLDCRQFLITGLKK